MKKITKNSISLAGEFAVLSQLASQGYDANMTLGNTKNVDILVSCPKTKRMYKIEVKTRYGNKNGKPTKSKMFGNTLAWIMNKKHESQKEKDLFYCFVSLGRDTHPNRFFVIPSKEVARYVKDRHKRWLKADKKHKDSSMRKFRVGFDKAGYTIPAPPPASRYENNWSFKK